MRSVWTSIRMPRYFPSAQDYLQQRKWVRRGDMLGYALGAQTPSFSTDAFGFRHTRFEGRVGEYDRLELVLGSSHIFGFALSHNGETLPCELGVARSELQQKRFGTRRRHFAASSQARQRLAEACRLKLMSFPAADDLLFVDEYHYRAESQSLIAERLAQQMT
jgi:hypothetical protein